jgi:hypothetical protein
VLTPSAIFRQVLWDPAEVAPVWARPKSTPGPAIASEPTPEPPPEPVAADDVATMDPAADEALPTADVATPPAKRPRQPRASGSGAAKPRSTTRTTTRSRKPKGDTTSG